MRTATAQGLIPSMRPAAITSPTGGREIVAGTTVTFAGEETTGSNGGSVALTVTSATTGSSVTAGTPVGDARWRGRSVDIAPYPSKNEPSLRNTVG
jgi:hypothetical protein